MNPFNIGFPSLILILIFLFLIFGPSKLPELGRSIAITLKEFKDATQNNFNDDTLDTDKEDNHEVNTND